MPGLALGTQSFGQPGPSLDFPEPVWLGFSRVGANEDLVRKLSSASRLPCQAAPPLHTQE